MIKLIVEDDEGRRTVHSSERPEITIGRHEGNTIRLTERNISRRHARIFRQNGSIIVEDLDSYNGVWVNGKLVEGRAPISEGDQIQIGDYHLAIHEEPTSHSVRVTPPPFSEEGSEAAPSSSAQEIPSESIPVEELPEPREAPRLVVMNTKYAGQEFVCRRNELLIGRSRQNDIALDHHSLSQTQARLSCSAEGDWQIIDLESSNGVRVNGKPFGKATLHSGDMLKLGRIKLKFVLPAPDAPIRGVVRPPAPAGPRNLVLASTILVAGLAAGLGIWWKGSEPRSPLGASGTAARTDLRPEQATESSDQVAGARAEQQEKAIAEKAASPDESRVDGPARQPRNEPDPKLASAATPAPSMVAKQAQPGTPSTQVQRLYEEGLGYYRKHQFSSAAASFNNCLRADPDFSKCHMVLGSTYARLREPELGAQHYRRFLQLAPDDPEAAKIRIYLEQYESAKANTR